MGDEWSWGGGAVGERRRACLKSQDLPGGHDVVDVDVLEERLQLRALLDLVLAHGLRHLFLHSDSGHRRRQEGKRGESITHACPA